MTLNELLALAGIVKDETGVKANTHSRIGLLFEYVINFFQGLIDGILIRLSNAESTLNDKGLFQTSELLSATWPIGKVGWWAYVTSTNTTWIWDKIQLMWVDSYGDYRGSSVKFIYQALSEVQKTQARENIGAASVAALTAIIQGGPKMPPYATAAALNTANPDHQYTYVVLADGYWYYWNVSSFIAGAPYISPNSVLYVDQSINELQKMQVRKNIGTSGATTEVIERLKYHDIAPSDRGIKKVVELSDIRATIEKQTSGTWSKFGYWSWATAKSDYVIDEIGLHVYSLTALTGDLHAKIFIDGVLMAYISKANADLGTPTVNTNIVYLDLGKRISIKTGQVICIGWEMSGSEKLQMVYCTVAVDASFPFGGNLAKYDASDGSIIAATTPPATPSAGSWYFPFYLRSYKIYDISNPAQMPNWDNLLTQQKNGASTYIVQERIMPPGGIWNAASSYNSKWFHMNLIGITTKIINRVSVPLQRNLYANTYFTDAITVKIYYDGRLLKTKVIAFSELASYNALTAASPVDSFFYDIDINDLLIEPGKVLFVGVECNALTDKIGMIYNMGAASDASEWTRNYTSSGNTTGGVIGIESQPALPASDGFYRVIRCSYRNYVAQLVQDGGVERSAETLVVPAKIYTVCNDLIQTNSGFDSRNYSACLYVDHFMKLTTKKKAFFASTKTDRLPIFAPIAADGTSYNNGVNVNTATITETIKGEINDVALSISHISTKASIAAAAFPKILCIGDSVTDGFLANMPISATTGNPAAYWSYVRKYFALDRLDAGSGHNCLMVGQQSVRNFTLNGTTYKNCAEGRGGWTTRNYLYDANANGYTNPFYDSSKTGVKFSLAKYLAQYKTLADDGVTRLQVGSTAGSLVTDVNNTDVCTPTHVVLQLGFNDVEANYAGDIALMINSIKAEFPNIIVIVSTIDAAGTYYPELYPKNGTNNLLASSLHTKMYNLVAAAKAFENVGSKIFYCPNYFIQPTGIAVAYRNVDYPESLANSEFYNKIQHGNGYTYHPNTYAHAAWGYQLYSLIMYTLTL